MLVYVIIHRENQTIKDFHIFRKLKKAQDSLTNKWIGNRDITKISETQLELHWPHHCMTETWTITEQEIS